MKKLIICFVLCNTFLMSELPIVSLYDMMQSNLDITYYKCHDAEFFNYAPFPLSVYPQFQPNKGLFAETFVAKIPNGSVCSHFGFVVVQNQIIEELLSQNFSVDRYKQILEHLNISNRQPQKITGKVAVLTRVGTDVYGHWLVDVLGRLEMLRKLDIEYDWLYVPCDKSYMYETLILLGVDPKKIVMPYGATFYIQADELIVPSLTIRRIPAQAEIDFSPIHPCTFYCAHWNIEFLRKSFLECYAQKVVSQQMPEKIFISRKDATSRRIINEDEIFGLFEPLGFQRVSLADMHFMMQVRLFNHAKYIVAAHGSALTNIIFCNSGTKIIEIFQNQFDSGFWQLSDQLDLDHYCIKTQEDLIDQSFKIDTFVPVEIIKNFIDQSSWLRSADDSNF